MLPWLALTFTAARLGFEAQNAAAFRFMRLGSRLENGRGRNHPPCGSIAGGASSTRGSRAKKASGREDIQEVGAGQAAAQAVKRTLIVRPRRRDSLG